jgi:hypothetical protein
MGTAIRRNWYLACEHLLKYWSNLLELLSATRRSGACEKRTKPRDYCYVLVEQDKGKRGLSISHSSADKSRTNMPVVSVNTLQAPLQKLHQADDRR